MRDDTKNGCVADYQGGSCGEVQLYVNSGCFNTGHATEAIKGTFLLHYEQSLVFLCVSVILCNNNVVVCNSAG